MGTGHIVVPIWNLPARANLQSLTASGQFFRTPDWMTIHEKVSSLRRNDRAWQTDQFFDEDAPARVRPVSLPSERNQLAALRHDIFFNQENGSGQALGDIQSNEIKATKCQVGRHSPKDNGKPTPRQFEISDMHGATVSVPPEKRFPKCVQPRHISSAQDSRRRQPTYNCPTACLQF